jgi:hypothetical protein
LASCNPGFAFSLLSLDISSQGFKKSSSSQPSQQQPFSSFAPKQAAGAADVYSDDARWISVVDCCSSVGGGLAAHVAC